MNKLVFPSDVNLEVKLLTQCNHMTHIPPPSNNHSEVYLRMKYEVFQEHLRQARYNFNLSVVASTISIGVSITGACLILSNKAPEGVVTSATGLISTSLCTQIARQSNDKLEELTETLHGEDREHRK
jgi:hypothetical protein